MNEVTFYRKTLFIHRAVGRSENLGVSVLFGGHNLPPLVDIGLTDLPKFGHPRYPRPVVKHSFPNDTSDTYTLNFTRVKRIQFYCCFVEATQIAVHTEWSATAQ